MQAVSFRIGYLDRPADQAFLDTAAGLPGLEVLRIASDLPDAELLARLAACHGYYVTSARDEVPHRWHVSADLLAQLPRLLLAVSYGAGFDTIDAAACTAAGVAVVNQAGGNAEAVAEHALALIIALRKRVPEAHAAMRAGAAGRREDFMGRDLAGATVGLVGLGHAGTRAAQLLAAFRCRVLAVDPFLDAAECARRGAAKVELPELLARSEVVSLHCPLDASTRGLFGAKAFAAMRPGTVFVSTARGGIHDEAALHAALQSGHLGGAGLDVWEREPPPADHPLLHHPRVLASPHTAGVTWESRSAIGRMAAEAFAAAARGALPPRLVNPAVADRFQSRWHATFGPAAPAAG
ncbi:NAD(P)-dependent oxidoreductase [Roseomonas sp. BN140053]|uniref:NAD(P)-dependent oxidoreductase n=1 Tax=Roseomonas sp. BN140053 TaxID=3391898 RepID=UPI0039EA1317